MVQASELRIGNYVYGVSDRIEQVELITSEGLIGTRLQNVPHLVTRNNAADISGIPLTEELLLKMRFEKNVETDTWFLHIKQPISKHNFSFIRVSLLVTNDTYFDVYIDNNFIMICEFVHDLQNVVWVLGKKELTLS